VPFLPFVPFLPYVPFLPFVFFVSAFYREFMKWLTDNFMDESPLALRERGRG